MTTVRRAFKSFSGGSDGEESTCNAEDLGLIPGSGRSAGEGIGYPLQYPCLGNRMDRGLTQGIYQAVVLTYQPSGFGKLK